MRAFWYDNKAVSNLPRHCKAQNTPPHADLASQGDQRELHDSGRDVSPEYLEKLGVLYFRFADVADVDKLASERSYKNRDVITVSPEKMGDIYEEKVKSFFHEHLHEDEEIRYIRDGAGFFDVRSEGDEWVRIQLEKDDLIVGSHTHTGGRGSDNGTMADLRDRFCRLEFTIDLRLMQIT